MPPISSLTGVLDSPAPSGNGSTTVKNSSLPDISLGSLGSSFHGDDDEFDEGTPKQNRQLSIRAALTVQG